MIPAYRNMDSYPFPHYYDPAMEHVPPQMTKSPFSYEKPWPYVSSYAPHFCYNHLPSYPPYVPSPSPMFYTGGSPSFFAPYSPHYSMEVPRYEYDKYMPKGHHCCGCSNHSCNQKEDRAVSIEEEKPNVGKKENDVMEFRNFPYPLVWIPPEYYGNRQMKIPTGVDEQGKMSHDKKLTGAEDFNADVQRAVEPRFWNGWLPFDVKGAPNSNKKEADDNVREYGNGKMDQKHLSEQQKRSEFPFPFIWFPSYNNQQDGGWTNNQKGVEEVPHIFKFVPVKSCADEGVAERTISNDVTEKVNNQRNIPVKQIELNHVQNNSMESEKKETNVPEGNVAKEDLHSVSKRRPISPTKGSKLPPVCLRVDPLPRKKNGLGKSRSLSPPGLREHSKAIACEASKTPLDTMTDKTEPGSPIQASQNKTSENMAANTEIPPALREHSKEIACETSNTPSDSMTDKTEPCSPIQASQTKTSGDMAANSEIHEGGKKEKRVLSDTNAAVVIQTVYRGYLVRKSEPLKKLRQIAEVSKEVTYVKDRIKAFEGSSNLQIDDKEKLAIGETIMRLLLKLDTIQGLHPSLREIRKSLARELVTLQEKFDSITLKNPPQQQMQELDAKNHLEISLQNGLNGEHNQEQQEDKVASQKDSSEGISDGKKPQDQFCMIDVDGLSESQSHDPGLNEGTNSATPPNELVNLDISPVVSVDAMDSTSNFSDKMEVELESEVIDIPIEVDKLNMNVFEELPVGVIDEDTTEDSPSERFDSDMCAIKELPVGVLDEKAATSEETNTAENEVFIKELPVELLDENAELEQPLVEEKEEVKSTEESDGWVKIDDELKVDSPMGTDELGEGNENDTMLPSLENEEENDVANIMLNENEPKEKLAEQETYIDVQDTDFGVKNSADDKNTETYANEETEPSEDVPLTKHNPDLNGNMMLLEENEKLRKLMKELLEAGNEQLSVISNLTGRVKDLERKLAKSRKSKKVKTKRHRSVTPKVSCDNSTE